MTKLIHAQKNGRTRSFHPATWEALGERKDGWERVKTAPEPQEAAKKKPKPKQ